MSEQRELFKSKHILFCNCKGESIDSYLLQTIGKYLEKLNVDVTILTDLCGVAACNKNLLTNLFINNTEYLVIGCYRRTMKLLFEQINNDFFAQTDFEHINLLQATSKEEVIDTINRFCGSYKGSSVHREIREDSGWPSWYPIIDYTRCTGCGQCADFCLFGVYEKNSNSVKVVNQKGCKNNCPACARICPATAIIFPKYTQGGAIGGSDEIDEQIEQQHQAKDIKSLLGDDLYTALEKRKAQRQSIIREEAMKRAIQEKNIAIQKDTKK